MKKIALLCTVMVLAIAALGVAAGPAAAINRNKYEWCYANDTCYGIVTLNTAGKTWSYRIGSTVEASGSFHKASGGEWIFDFTNATAEACQVRMKKVRRSFRGAEYCEGQEVETARWRRL
jgi:hypothetical protein